LDPLSGQSQDVVYLIVWSLLVLNTDTHNPKV
jgi:Sec7-like guanine-nucleotide exchange factor